MIIGNYKFFIKDGVFGIFFKNDYFSKICGSTERTHLKIGNFGVSSSAFPEIQEEEIFLTGTRESNYTGWCEEFKNRLYEIIETVFLADKEVKKRFFVDGNVNKKTKEVFEEYPIEISVVEELIEESGEFEEEDFGEKLFSFFIKDENDLKTIKNFLERGNI